MNHAELGSAYQTLMPRQGRDTTNYEKGLGEGKLESYFRTNYTVLTINFSKGNLGRCTGIRSG